MLGALSIVLASCNSELQVLEPFVPVEMPQPDAQVLDAGDAALPFDAQVLPDAELGMRDASDGDAAVLSDSGLPRVGPRSINAFAQTCMTLDGTLSCWGEDERGQVGVAGSAAQPRPVIISGDSFVEACAGERHSCALRSDGAALCWGSNSRGELGVGDFASRELPTELSSRRFRAIACGGFNTCALTLRGELFCWGENSEGKLGQGDPPPEMPGTMPNMASPVSVGGELRFSQVSVGQGHVCAVSNAGGLYCWGRNNRGQIGVSDTRSQYRAPTRVAEGTAFTHAAAGQRHSCAIDVEGKLLCWGENTEGLLGLTTDVEVVRLPTVLGASSDYVEVKTNWFHSCALKKSGTLVCWGRNEEGQLGLSDTMTRTTPTRVGPEFSWLTFAVGQFHSCAFDEEGPSCWGENLVGQLGVGDMARRYLPSRVALP